MPSDSLNRRAFITLLAAASAAWSLAFRKSTYGQKANRLAILCLLLVCSPLSILIAAPVAHAVCKSPKNICKHIDECLQRTSDPNKKDVERIREGVRARDGKMVRTGAEICARELGKTRQWDNWTSGCSDVEYVSIAKVEVEIGKVYCDRYSQ